MPAVFWMHSCKALCINVFVIMDVSQLIWKLPFVERKSTSIINIFKEKSLRVTGVQEPDCFLLV